jgi:hypothetical protein
VVNPDNAGKLRMMLQRATLLALREMMKQTDTNATTYDLAAFIAMNLLAIHATVESSVAAWEKRGYWVKADRFRREWSWAQRFGEQLKEALLEDDWMEVANISSQVAGKLAAVKLPVRNRLGTPWVGSWEKLSKSP